MGSGDEALRIRRQRFEEGHPARGVQFPEDVVDQMNGRVARFFRQQGRLGQLHGNGDGALLPFRGILGGAPAVERHVQVIPVRAVLGLSVPDVPFQGGAEPFVQVPFFRGAVGHVHLFLSAADVAVGQRDVGQQERQEAGAQAPEFRAVKGQLPGVGVQLELVPVLVLEQVVARFQRPSVAEQGHPVAGVPLASQKVHVFPPGIRSGLDQGKVVIAHPDDGIAVRQVAALVFPRFSVHAEVRGVRGPQDAPGLAGEFSADAEGVPAVGRQRAGPGGARGLQAQQEADGFH